MASDVGRLDWEARFMRNCEEVAEFAWVAALAEAVEGFDLPKAKYVREVAALKREKAKLSAVEAQKQPSPAELEAFRKNLKKSVIMSFGPGCKPAGEAYRSTINVKKSRIEFQAKSKVLPPRSEVGLEKSPSNLSRSNFKKSIIEFVDDR